MADHARPKEFVQLSDQPVNVVDEMYSSDAELIQDSVDPFAAINAKDDEPNEGTERKEERKKGTENKQKDKTPSKFKGKSKLSSKNKVLISHQILTNKAEKNVFHFFLQIEKKGGPSFQH